MSIIGIPREMKPLEGRVSLVPEACAELGRGGHEVLVETGAGLKAGFPDERYQRAGARIVADAARLYREARVIVKVKEPVNEDLQYLREDHLLFCFLHLAANDELTRRLCEIGLTAVAFETVEEDEQLPLLAPMSDIAGRLSVQIGTHLLHQPQGGKGVMLGGVAGTRRGHVVVLGAGAAGGSAVAVAASLGARITVFDRRPERLAAMREIGANVEALYAYSDAVAQAVAEADLLIGAVLIPGARAERVVSAEQVAGMQSGSVIVDISVDQGGCIATTRPTSYDSPTYIAEGVLHFCVTNMPGGVPRTSTQALSAVLLPFVQRLASDDWAQYQPLSRGINVAGGRLVHPALRPG